MHELIIYGAGAFARELVWLVESAGGPYRPVALLDDRPECHGYKVRGIPVMGLDEAVHQFPGAEYCVAVGGPTDRQRLAECMDRTGLRPATLIHPRVERSDRVEIGTGTVICAGSILTVDIRLGRHVQINPGCTIAHDAVFGDYATLAPGVHISGWVHLGRRVYVGSGAVVVNGSADRPLTIGDDAVVGAGAVVTRNVAEGATVVGVPARVIKSARVHRTPST